MSLNPQVTEENLNGKIHFLCSVGAVDDYFNDCLW